MASFITIFSIYLASHILGLQQYKLSQPDKTWAQFSTLHVGKVVHAMLLHSYQRQPNFQAKTWSRLLLVSLPISSHTPRNVNDRGLHHFACLK